jgi:hypothetical protein
VARALRAEDVHQKVGEIMTGEMIHEWVFHDLGHLSQILELDCPCGQAD